MGKDAERKVELSKVRLFNFEHATKSISQEIEASIYSYRIGDPAQTEIRNT